MSDTMAAVLQVGLLVVALAAAYRPLGDFMCRTYTSQTDWRAERVIYRIGGVDPRSDQRWGVSTLR